MDESVDLRDQRCGEGPHDAVRERIVEVREPARLSVIVPCPACAGSGRVLRDGSQVLLGCRLCWERGLVARIAAEQYLRATRLAASRQTP